MAPFAREAGSASALMGAIQMAIGAFSSAMVGLVSNGTAVPLTAVMAVCSWSALIILLTGSRVLSRIAKKKDIQEQTLNMIEGT